LPFFAIKIDTPSPRDDDYCYITESYHIVHVDTDELPTVFTSRLIYAKIEDNIFNFVYEYAFTIKLPRLGSLPFPQSTLSAFEIHLLCVFQRDTRPEFMTDDSDYPIHKDSQWNNAAMYPRLMYTRI